ncbi:MAG: hypothetical protein J7501_09250 [Bdellovibrio sp.]|nr:hypothetical protein [Bdellovibrio sp.]
MSISCPYCKSQNSPSKSRALIVAAGYFTRRSDNIREQRFTCKPCKRTFSTATSKICYRQRKRHINPIIFGTMVSGISQRRLAFLLQVNRKTAIRRLAFLGIASDRVLKELRSEYPLATDIQFDELETFEHSKLKPLSVMTIVETETRRILGFRVARIPAKGLLAKKSVKKYGKRIDERKKCRRQLFEEIKPLLAEGCIIRSDENPHYKNDVKEFFPNSSHKTYLGRRGCVVGQGELKAGGFDPLFSLNHTYAMKRANINRLFRRTWNTTKKPECLTLHLAMYTLYHNEFLLWNKAR